MPLSRRTFLRSSGAGAAGALAVSSVGELCEATGFAGERVGGSPASGTWIRLHHNENAYGPSESVKAAIRRALGGTNRYPESAVETLRERLAVLHGVAREQIVLGCGSGEILRAAVETLATPRKNVVVAAPTCSVIDHYARSAGADVVSVALSPDYSHNLQGMLARSNANTGLVYICNPNNPTGTTTRSDDVEQFLRKLPISVHVLIDEAYLRLRREIFGLLLRCRAGRRRQPHHRDSHVLQDSRSGRAPRWLRGHVVKNGSDIRVAAAGRQPERHCGAGSDCSS